MSDEKLAVVRRTRAEWQVILSRIERNDQGRPEFCEAEGLTLGTFSGAETSRPGRSLSSPARRRVPCACRSCAPSGARRGPS